MKQALTDIYEWAKFLSATAAIIIGVAVAIGTLVFFPPMFLVLLVIALGVFAWIETGDA